MFSGMKKEALPLLAIALEKVKATEVSKQGNTENGVTQNSRSVASISIARLSAKINPNNVRFTKYIPLRERGKMHMSVTKHNKKGT